MKTKLISLVSVILLSIGVIYAEKVKIGDLYYNLNASDLTAEVAQSDNYYEGLTDIEIPSSVTYNDVQYSVTSIGGGAFDNCSYLTSVTIPNSVTTIGAMAFDWCASLTAVTIPNSVINIKSGAFYYCQGLSSLEIPSSVTNIENSAFFGCTRVTSITVDAGNPIYDSRDNCNAIVETASNTLFLGCQSTIIPSSVISIGDGAYAGSGLDSIDIPNNITSIGDGAFSACFNLIWATIPSSVTHMGEGVFQNCNGLSSVTISANVTDIGNNVFAGCYDLSSVNILSSITSIGDEAFRDCTQLKSITIPTSVTSIGSLAFGWCTVLSSIDIPNNVTSIGYGAFQMCSRLNSITCRATNVPNLEGDNAFSDVDKSIPLYVPSGSVAAYQAAEGWSEFTNIQAIPSSEPDYKYYIVGSMNDWSVNENYEMTLNSESWATEYMIEIALTTASQFKVVKVDGENQTWYPDGMGNNYGENGEIAKDGNYTIYFRPNNDGSNDWFYNCIYADRHLVQEPVVLTVLFPENGKPTAGIKVLGSFSADALDMELIEATGYYAHYSIMATEEDVFYFRDAADEENVLYKKNYSGEWDTAMFTFGDVWIDDTWKGEPVKMVELEFYDDYQYAWKNDIESSDGSKVRIGDLYYNLNVDAQTAEVTSQDSEYPYWSISLTTVEIPASIVYRGVTYSVTSIGNAAFGGCAELTSVTIPSSVTSIGNMAFFGCYALSSIDIPSSVTSIGEYAFEYCSLNSIDFPNSVTSVGEWAFSQCNNLTSVTIPSSVTNIGNNAFSDCSSLTSIIVESGNLVYDSRDNCNAIIETATNTLFMGCQSTVIPSSVTSIGSSAFYHCSSMTSIDIPSSVTSIESLAFGDCSGLTSVTIPSSVTNIGGTAFRYCSGLTSITCQAASAPELGDNVFEDVDKSIPLYVPSSSVSAYQAASGWSEFTNIRAIGGNSGGNTPLFPGDPGTLTLNLELKAAVVDGDEIQGYEPIGGGGYAKGSSVTITAQEIPGYAFVQWSDSITDMQRTIVLDQSMTLTALYSHSMIEIPVAANKWTFICLPPLGERQYTEDMFTYDGLTDVQWGTYNGAKRAAGQSGWETPEVFNALQGYIIFSTTAGTLRINAYQDEIRQGESGNTIYAGMIDYASSHAQNSNWNFVGNPFNDGYNIAGFADAGITSPITVWNGTAYTTYTPGIDSYILNPFEAFFIQKAENGAESLPFDSEYLSSNGGNSSSVADEMGTLPGYFSVSSNQRIRFSKGNLQYRASTNTWRFARNQYDIIGDDNVNISPTYDGWIDLFGWGTGNNPTLSSKEPTDYSTFVDWGTNAISNGGNEANLWRTPTNDEWGYLFQTRTNATALFGYSTVNGISGMIILPDEWQGVAGISFVSGIGDFSQNIFTLEQWNKMESVGAVFLPAEVFRGGVNMRSESVFGGRYWSSTPYNENWAYHLYFGAGDLTPQHNAGGRYSGWGVRLVR